MLLVTTLEAKAHTVQSLSYRVALAQTALAEPFPPVSPEAGEALLNVLCTLATECLSVVNYIQEDFECKATIAEIAANGIAIFAAGLLVGCSQASIACVERLSRALDECAAPIFVELCRLEMESQLEQGDQSVLLAMQSICTWALVAVGRTMGYARLSGQVLWVWASRDVLWALVLAKGVLSIPSHRLSLPPANEVLELQRVIFVAVCDLASPSVVFCTEDGCISGNDVPITCRNAKLARHRAQLATALISTQLHRILIDAAVRLGAATGPQLVSFLAVLHQPELCRPDLGTVTFQADDILVEAQSAAALLTSHLKIHERELWCLLANAPASEQRLPSGFAHTCADLAYFVPPSTQILLGFVSACFAIGGVADSSLLAALCILAANSLFLPEPCILLNALVSLNQEMKAGVAARWESWRGPVQMSYFEQWAAIVEVPLAAMPAVASVPVGVDAGPIVPARASVLQHLVGSAPSEFLCAWDGRLMMDPVVSPQGFAFERAGLVHALAKSGGCCPLTSEPLSLGDCTRCPELRRRITMWVRSQQGNTQEYVS